MTPKGAAKQPRPFWCPFCFLARRFCRPLYCLAAAVLPPFFCFPSPSPLLLAFVTTGNRPATFCQLLPAPALSKFTFCQLSANFRLRPLWQSWHFVNFWRHFATLCQPAVNFLPTFARAPLWQSWHFVNFWRHFAHLRRAFCHLLFTFLPYFRFFASFNFTSAGL